MSDSLLNRELELYRRRFGCPFVILCVYRLNCRGYLDRPPEELAGYCNSEQYRRLLQGSLTDPEALVSSTEGLCDIHPFQGFDFGLQRCGHSTGKTGYDGDGALLPSATRDVVVAAREARDAPTFYSTVRLSSLLLRPLCVGVSGFRFRCARTGLRTRQPLP